MTHTPFVIYEHNASHFTMDDLFILIEETQLQDEELHVFADVMLNAVQQYTKNKRRRKRGVSTKRYSILLMR